MAVHASAEMANHILSDEVIGTSWANGYAGRPLDFKTGAHYTVIISFRGTEGVFDDWLTNLDVRTIDCDDVSYPCSIPDDDDDSSGKVHAGFFREYEAVRPLIQRVLSRIYLRPNAGLHDVTILFTGHSQGGAIATLAELEAGSWFKEMPSVEVGGVTFGAPRVGFGHFAEMHERLVGTSFHWRVEADHDPVVTVPPVYEHVGIERGFDCEHWILRYKCHAFAGYLEYALQGAFYTSLSWPGKEIFVSRLTLAGTIMLRDAETGEETGLSAAAIAAIAVGACCILACVSAIVVVVALASMRRRRQHKAHQSLAVAPSHLAGEGGGHRAAPRRSSSRRLDRRRSSAASLHSTSKPVR